MSSFKHILTKSQNGVKTITLNRPDKRNALSPMLIDELTQALHEAETCDCGVVILTGVLRRPGHGAPGDDECAHAAGASRGLREHGSRAAHPV